MDLVKKYLGESFEGDNFSTIQAKFSKDELEIIKSAINMLSTGGGPMATDKNIGYFKILFVRDILQQTVKHKKINPAGKKSADKALYRLNRLY